MAPDVTRYRPTGLSFSEHEMEDVEKKGTTQNEPCELPYTWGGMVFYTYIHILAACGLYLVFTRPLTTVTLMTMAYALLLGTVSLLAVTTGAHRLWSHKAYKAKLQLKILLAVFFSISMQESIKDWARQHRAHHKYSDTDADPYNTSRGFWASHLGWLMTHRHPLVIEYEKKIDFSDLENDPVVSFQHKHIYVIMFLSILLPGLVPIYFWGEEILASYVITIGLRTVATVHIALAINSYGHRWGAQPYQKDIAPRDNYYISFLTLGEGFHNYHHAFPWDYRTTDVHGRWLTTSFVEWMAKIGWAYDLKTTSPELIRARVERTGDGSHEMLSSWRDAADKFLTRLHCSDYLYLARIIRAAPGEDFGMLSSTFSELMWRTESYAYYLHSSHVDDRYPLLEHFLCSIGLVYLNSRFFATPGNPRAAWEGKST